MKQNSMKCLKDLDVERKKKIQSELVRLIESTSIFALLMSSHANVLSENIVLIDLRLLMSENVDKRDREQRRFEWRNHAEQKNERKWIKKRKRQRARMKEKEKRWVKIVENWKAKSKQTQDEVRVDADEISWSWILRRDEWSLFNSKMNELMNECKDVEKELAWRVARELQQMIQWFWNRIRDHDFLVREKSLKHLVHFSRIRMRRFEFSSQMSCSSSRLALQITNSIDFDRVENVVDDVLKIRIFFIAFFELMKKNDCFDHDEILVSFEFSSTSKITKKIRLNEFRDKKMRNLTSIDRENCDEIEWTMTKREQKRIDETFEHDFKKTFEHDFKTRVDENELIRRWRRWTIFDDDKTLKTNK